MNRVILSVVLLTGCGTGSWAIQPPSSRQKLVGCIIEVMEHECGSTAVEVPEVEMCGNVMVARYQRALNKTKWLREHGCDKY